MAYKIQNSDTIKEIRDAARLSISEGYPDKLDEGVKAVINVNPLPNIVADIARGAACVNATSTTIYNVPSNQDFYLTAASITVAKDATSTSTETSIKATINGALQRILSIAGLTLTAQSATLSLTFDAPIKIDSGTGILVTNGTAVANVNAWGNIAGFLVNK